MPFFVITGIFLVLTVGCMQFTKQNFAVCLCANLFGLIFFGYCFALFNGLSLGILVLQGWIAANTLVCVGAFIRHIQKKHSFRFCPMSTALFIACMGCLWFLTRGRLYTDWDEFSFWGSAVKFMMYENTLYTSPAFDNLFRSYPPAQILLQYFVMKASMIPFREDALIFIACLPAVCVFLYPVQVFIERKKYLFSAFCYILLVCVPVMLEPTSYIKTTVDSKLGILIAFLLFVAIFPQNRSVKLFLLCAGGACLTLYKTTGFPLAILTLFCCAGLLLVQEKPAFSKLSAKQKIKQTACLLSPFLFLFAVYFSWSLHLSLRGVENKWKSTVPVSQKPELQPQLIQNFLNELFISSTQGSFLKFSAFGWVIICAVLLGLACYFVKTPLKKVFLLGGISAISVCMLFAASLLYSYLFVFDFFEAIALASFHRYLNSGLIALLAVVLSLVLLSVCESPLQKRFTFPALALCAILAVNSQGSVGFLNLLIHAPAAAAQTQHDRYLFLRTARYIRQLGEAQPKLYLITANDAGLTEMIVRYELEPQTKLPAHSTILSAQEHSDLWVKQMSAEEWSRLLAQEYEYVYIHCPEPQFVADYLSVFEDESQVVVDRMFKVIVQSDGTALLRRIEMAPEDGYLR